MTAAQIFSSSTPKAESSAFLYQTFLETVAVNAGLDSTYDARDIAEVVFRSMRDVMPTDVSNRIAVELDGKSDSLARLWIVNCFNLAVYFQNCLNCFPLLDSNNTFI